VLTRVPEKKCPVHKAGQGTGGGEKKTLQKRRALLKLVRITLIKKVAGGPNWTEGKKFVRKEGGEWVERGGKKPKSRPAWGTGSLDPGAKERG